jgi:hypothetical protein
MRKVRVFGAGERMNGHRTRRSNCSERCLRATPWLNAELIRFNEPKARSRLALRHLRRRRRKHRRRLSRELEDSSRFKRTQPCPPANSADRKFGLFGELSSWKRFCSSAHGKRILPTRRVPAQLGLAQTANYVFSSTTATNPRARF